MKCEKYTTVAQEMVQITFEKPSDRKDSAFCYEFTKINANTALANAKFINKYKCAEIFVESIKCSLIIHRM